MSDTTSDDVKHPSHYCVGGYECIDIMDALDLHRHLAAAFKYIWRCGRKGEGVVLEIKDIRKAIQYLERYITILEKKQ